MALPLRSLLWIDGVGGFVVLAGATVAIGAGTGWNAQSPDLPLFGAISSRQAVLVRDREGYTLQPLKPMQRNGLPLLAPAMLASGDWIEFGGGAAARFTIPHPWSQTARLDFSVGRRLPRGVLSVILWADALVLGPQPPCHVEARDAEAEILVARRPNGFFYRSAVPLAVGGRLPGTEGEGGLGESLQGGGWSLRWEALPGGEA